MKSYYIANSVRIDVDDAYPWKSTLFVEGLSSEDPNSPYGGTISLKYTKNIDKSGTRSIGDGACIGKNVYIDEKYGVRFEVIADNRFMLTVEQECNEWLVIAFELLLLNQNKTLIHAAAVEKDGDAIVMPSWGGVGKTAIVCNMVKEHGYNLLGDDLVIINGTRVEPFLKRFVIYPYHKSLFPELFTHDAEHHIIENLAMSNFLREVLPSIKRILRPFPRTLAFLRKHNPHSMRVSPQDIFDSSCFSAGGRPGKVVWLDRYDGNVVVHEKISVEQLASRTTAVTSIELFAEKLECVYHMCGCGELEYNNVFQKINEIVTRFAEQSEVEILMVPISVPIEKIGEIIFGTLVENAGGGALYLGKIDN